MTGRAVVAIGVALAVAAPAAAQPAQPAPPAAAPVQQRVMVLKLDVGAGVEPGFADRTQSEIEAQAKKSGLAVDKGAANLADTAALAGCTSKVAADCLDQIIATLGVDELVYASVERSMASNRVTVARVRAKAKPLEITIDVPAGDRDGQVRALQPPLEKLFPQVAGGGPSEPPPGAGGAGGTAPPPPPQPEYDIVRNRRVLYAGIGVGGAFAVTGVALWFKASSMQGDIDEAPTETIDDFRHLRDLEDSAGRYATWGNVLFFSGLAIGAGATAYWYFRGERVPHNRAAPPPPPTEAPPPPTEAPAAPPAPEGVDDEVPPPPPPKASARLRVGPWVTPGGGGGIVLSWGAP